MEPFKLKAAEIPDQRTPMFRLTIDLPPAPTDSIHPSRELARAELLRFFTETGQAYRVTEAGWTHTSYDIVERSDGRKLLGRGVIDKLCGCDHTHVEHDDVGCTVTVLEQARLADCECRCYEPVPGEPTLFDVETCLTAGPPRPT
jgi:hypothetical protein